MQWWRGDTRPDPWNLPRGPLERSRANPLGVARRSPTNHWLSPRWNHTQRPYRRAISQRQHGSIGTSLLLRSYGWGECALVGQLPDTECGLSFPFGLQDHLL